MSPLPSPDPSAAAAAARAAGSPAAAAAAATWPGRAGLLVLVAASALAALAAGLAVVATDGLGWPPSVAAAAAALVAALPPLGAALHLARRARWQLARIGELEAPVRRSDERAAFLALVEREWSRARRYGHGAAVLIVEVDRHHRLGETRGAAALAALVEAMARHARQTLRGGDALSAWGEGQLAVFLAHADPTGALDAAERIREGLEQLQVDAPDGPLRASVSIGVATLRPAQPGLQGLLDEATLAVLAARQAGGNCVRAAPADAGSLQAPGSSIGDSHPAGPV
jgi:diguanylate cyclase (GGDEF)-like protein